MRYLILLALLALGACGAWTPQQEYNFAWSKYCTSSAPAAVGLGGGTTVSFNKSNAPKGCGVGERISPQAVSAALVGDAYKFAGNPSSSKPSKGNVSAPAIAPSPTIPVR